MTPANFTDADEELAVYRGSRWAHTFTFTDSETGDPVDLTGYLPFVMTFKNPTTDALRFNATIDSTNAATGILLVSATAAQTDTLSRGKVRLGMRDNANNPWGEGVVSVLKFTPDPA